LGRYIKGWSEGVDWESNSGVTALVQSARQGRIENCMQLLERGARVDFETKTGLVALTEAARNGRAL
jgi:ankyrin repeat protein